MRFLLIVFSILGLFASAAQATPVLHEVNTHFVGQTFIAELMFDDKVEAKDILVEYINQTIQVNIPNTTVNKGKNLKRINKNSVKSIYTYQFDPSTMRTRIIHDETIEASKFKGMVSVDADGKRLIITVNDPKAVASAQEKAKTLPVIAPISIDESMSSTALDTKLNRAETIVEKELGIPLTLPEKIKKVNQIETSEDAKQVKKSSSYEKEKSRATLETAMVKADLGSEEKSEEDIPVFKGNNKVESVTSSSFNRMIYSVLVILIFAGGLLVFLKWYSKNHKPKDSNTKIQVLTQHHLGPKKNLVIVRVAGESILLGVTDQNISMIKTLSFIDDELLDEVPSSFVNEMDERERSPSPKELVKVTYNPEEHSLQDIESQVKSKLNSMRYI